MTLVSGINVPSSLVGSIHVISILVLEGNEVKLFLDTANIQDIRDGARMGVINGVTTNPSLAASQGISDAEGYKTAVREISDIVDGPISVEYREAHERPGGFYSVEVLSQALRRTLQYELVIRPLKDNINYLYDPLYIL